MKSFFIFFFFLISFITNGQHLITYPESNCIFANLFYANLETGCLVVDIEKMNATYADIEIIDYKGSSVSSEIYQDKIGLQKLKLDIYGYKSGIYIIIINVPECGKLVYKLLIIK